MTVSSIGLILLIIGFSSGFLLYYSNSRLLAKGVRLPGPKPSFFAGNVHQLPRLEPWKTFAAWGKIYGPIFYFRMFNHKTVVLNSAKVATDLLEARSSIYSDRPTLWMDGELGGAKKSVFLTSLSDPRFRVLRRLLHNGLNPRAAKSYRQIQAQEALVLLKSLLKSPDQYGAHFRRNAAAVILKIAYGYQVGGNDDPLILLVERAFQVSAVSSVPGRFWIEFLPILRFVPEWFPGAGFKRIAREIRKELSGMETIPFQWAKREIATGEFSKSFVSEHLLGAEVDNAMETNDEDDVKWASSALYVGGGDTTVSAMTTFLLLMTLHPEVQKKAQAEIDQVAIDRLPILDDYDSLPYTKALVKETLRWSPVVPLGLPHRLTEDDLYENYWLPKGTRVFANIWAITHDEEVYPDPFTFDPSRHLGDDPQPDPLKYVFGFGRRVCPGAHLAEMSLVLNITNILAVFDITKAVDGSGVEIEPEIVWSTGVTSHLKAFKYQLKPRSAEHLLLLEGHD